MTSITRHLIPWPIEQLGIAVIGKECYTSLIENLDIGDVKCIKYSISKGLGFGIVVGGSIVKVPQVMLIVNAKSARGLSLIAYVLETLSYAITLEYSYRNEFPFSTYGENFFLTIQNVLITLLIIIYAPGKSDKTTNALMAALSLLLFLFGTSLLSLPHLALLQLTTLPLSLFSKLPQIFQNARAQSTGQLSAFAVVAQVLGCAARLFTTATEVNDSIVAAGFALALLLNLVLGAQLWMYWGRDEVRERAVPVSVPAEKEKETAVKVTAYEPTPAAWQERAATPPPSSGGRKWARKVD